MLIGVVGWVVLGMILGFIASRVISLRGDDPRMGIGTGVIGAVIGGVLYSHFSGSPVSYFNVMSLFFAAIAAVVALTIWHGWRWKSA